MINIYEPLLTSTTLLTTSKTTSNSPIHHSESVFDPGICGWTPNDRITVALGVEAAVANEQHLGTQGTRPPWDCGMSKSCELYKQYAYIYEIYRYRYGYG